MKTDNKVLALLQKVNEKKEAIQNAEKPDWKTTCSLRTVIMPEMRSNVHSYINIQTVRDVETLINLFAFLKTKQVYFLQAADTLGSDALFTWQGFSIEEWEHDFKTRLTQIELADKKKELKRLDARLSKLISPELRAELELADIEKALS